MKSLFLSILLVAGLLASSVHADEAGTKETLVNRTGFLFSFSSAMELSRPSGTDTDYRYTYTEWLGADYFWSERFGAFLGLQYHNRGFRSAGLANTADYLDIPFGFSMRRQGDLFSENSVNIVRAGGFLAIPLENFNGNLPTAASQQSQSFWGLTIEGSTIYPLSDGFGLGPVAMIKVGLGNAIKNEPTSEWFFHYVLGVQALF